MKELVNICCVLTGDWPGSSAAVRATCPDLGAHYVRTLKEMIDRHAPPGQPYTFICFTDRVIPNIPGVGCRPIPQGITTYFNKLWLFNPNVYTLGERVLFFDLDTVIVKSWANLATVPLEVPVMLNDLWAEPRPASGVMSWRVSAQTHAIWQDFEVMAHRPPPYQHPRPRPYHQHLNANAIRTDEEWLLHYLVPHNWTAWQELCPGEFASYKFQIVRSMRGAGQMAEPLTAAAARKLSVIYMHGLPRPHSIQAPWNPLYLSTTHPQPFTEDDIK